MFPTSLDEDMRQMRDPAFARGLSVRQYNAMVYRTEQKRILINQIRLCKVLMQILERLMRGSTLEFAVMRVHEYESQKDHPVNRLMLQSYLNQLQEGLKANQALYYQQKGLSQEEGESLLKSVHRELKQDMSKLQFKQFEIKGYETMITRVMEGQLTSHPDMNDQFLTVTQALEKQKIEND